MLRKRISSILVAGIVTLSMTGCNMKEEYRQLLEHELQRIEEPVEYELPHMEQEAKDIENKVQSKQSREDLYKQVNEGKVEQKQPKQQSESSKSNDESTRKPRYNGAGVYVGDLTDSEVERLNKATDKTLDKLQKELEKEIEKELQQMEQQVTDKEQVKQQEINDEEQVKSGHTAYDESDDRINDVIDEREDYWRTDGDVPNNEPTTEESNEPKVRINVQDIQESQEYVEQFNN